MRLWRAVQGLRWRNPRITQLVKTLATRRRSLAGVHPANLCGDARTWAAGDFRDLAPETVRLNSELSPMRLAQVAEGPGTAEATISDLLLPYETSRARTISRQITLFASQTIQEVRRVQPAAWIRIYDAMGL